MGIPCHQGVEVEVPSPITVPGHQRDGAPPRVPLPPARLPPSCSGSWTTPASSPPSFLSHLPARVAYLSAITVLGALVVAVLLAPSCPSPRYRRLRATLFLAMGLSGVIPAVHALWINCGHAACYLALGLEVAMGGSPYAVGSWFYVSRVPEKWRPGVFVLVGAITHYVAVAVAVLVPWREKVSHACGSAS